MDSPYSNLPDRAFWRTAVGEREPLDPGDLYVQKFPINKSMRIVTAGSCFAQHVGRVLRESGFAVVDTEPAPSALPDEVVQKFGYRLFSARYGNVYTTRQLLQLLDEVEGIATPAEPVWERNGRFFDAMRPGVEPSGLPSPEDVLEHRRLHLKAVDEAFSSVDLFVFTFGLTEAWVHTESGTVYPTAPGTIAGNFDKNKYSFVNFGFADVLRDFQTFRARMLKRQPRLKFLVTVSPVPLTATASGHHVEVATAYSKAVLRAVAGQISATSPNVDYFPSYEIITSANNRGVYFETNKRSVSMLGVETAMSLFMRAHQVSGTPEATPDPGSKRTKRRAEGNQEDDAAAELVCEEALLEAFRKWQGFSSSATRTVPRSGLPGTAWPNSSPRLRCDSLLLAVMRFVASIWMTAAFSAASQSLLFRRTTCSGSDFRMTGSRLTAIGQIMSF